MHYPGHLRDAFSEWVEAGRPETATVEVDYEPQTWPAERLLGRFVHCSDVMPASLCGDLERQAGTTYASAAQALLAERRVASV